MGILQDLLIDTESTVEINGASITIYPLTLKDFSVLLSRFYKEMSQMLDGKPILPQTHPEFISYLVACGVRDEDALKLPAGIQLKLYEKIMEISEISEETLGKLSASIVQGDILANQMTAAANAAVAKHLAEQERAEQAQRNSSKTSRRL